MKPKKRLNIRQLPALAKTHLALSGKHASAVGVKLEGAAEKRFFAQFVKAFFSRDAWLARATMTRYYSRRKGEIRLDLMRSYLIKKRIAKTIQEADKIILAKKRQYLEKMSAVEASLGKQRFKLTIPRYADAHHELIMAEQGIANFLHEIDDAISG